MTCSVKNCKNAPVSGRKQCQSCRDRLNRRLRASRARSRQARRDRATFRGESTIQRCLREARAAITKRGLRDPGVSSYGTNNHDAKSRYDRLVGEEFRRRLIEAGITVEGM